jgi:hypothetical protein
MCLNVCCEYFRENIIFKNSAKYTEYRISRKMKLPELPAKNSH